MGAGGERPGRHRGKWQDHSPGKQTLTVLCRPGHSAFISLSNCMSAGGDRALPPPRAGKKLSPSGGSRGDPPRTFEVGDGKGPQNLEPICLQGREGGFRLWGPGQGCESLISTKNNHFVPFLGARTQSLTVFFCVYFLPKGQNLSSETISVHQILFPVI